MSKSIGRKKREEEGTELSSLVEGYSAVSVHGVLPLRIDSASGALRFARLGEELPEDCLSRPDLLPDAHIELFVFHDTSALAHWKAAILEVSGNAIDLVLPETRWPKAVLLVRHDRPGRRGATMEECVGIRLPLGGVPDPAAAARLGQEIRRNWLKMWLHERDDRAFAASWATEIETLRRVPEAEVVGRASGNAASLTFSLTPEGGFKGTGPSFSVSRDGDSYLAAWPLEMIRLDGEACQRIDEAAEAFGAERDGRLMRMKLSSLSRENVLRLGEASAMVLEAAAGGIPAPGR